LQIKNLSAGYIPGVLVVKDVTMSLSYEHTVAIVGESGSGKSTLVNLIAGLSMPDGGSIFLDGECLFSDREAIHVPAERRRIAVVFQQPYLFPHLTVKGNLLYGYRRCARENRNIKFDSLVFDGHFRL